jgi:hypothetical protein
MIEETCSNCFNKPKESEKMRNNIARLLPVVLMVGVSMNTLARPAQANPFDFLNGINRTVNDVNNTVNSVKGTQQNAGGALGNLTNFLGIGQPASNNSSDPTAQVLEVYAKWYTSVSPADKEIVNMLTTQFAEDTPMTFAAFSKTPFYKGKDAQGKSQASATFFKFSEVIKAVGPQKDKFLAYAFCVNGGGKDCK